MTVQPTPFFIDAAAVAQLLDLHDGDAFLRRRALMQAQGFPAPVDFIRRPRKWNRAAVLAWRDRTADIHLPPDPTGKVVILPRLMQMARQA